MENVEPLSHIDRFLPFQDRTVLHVLCGDGKSCKRLLQEFKAKALHGVDPVPSNVVNARNECWGLAATFQLHDPCSTHRPWSSFDYVLAFGLHKLCGTGAVLRFARHAARAYAFDLFGHEDHEAVDAGLRERGMLRVAVLPGNVLVYCRQSEI